MKLAIAILNWNGLSHLQTFLPSVVEYSTEHSIYLIDNASTDNSVAWVTKTYPQVSIIVNAQNGGFCKGYNDGLKQIEAEFFVLLNSDVEVTANWLNPILSILENDPKVAAVQPKILSYLQKNTFEYAGAAGGYLDWLGYPFCRGRIFDSVEKDENQYNDTTEIFWASGACMFIRASLFSELGGFDEAFFAHMEEIDLCWQLKNKGYKIMYTGESKVYHLGGGTLQKTNVFKTYLNYRNGLFLLYKNLPKKRLFSTILIRLVLDGISGARHLLRFEFSFILAIIKAHFSFYSIIFKGKVARINHTNFETSPILYRSVVWEYFAKGKKVYSDLINLEKQN